MFRGMFHIKELSGAILFAQLSRIFLELKIAEI